MIFAAAPNDGEARGAGILAGIEGIADRKRVEEAVLAAEINERCRLSRELHDQIGQPIAALLLKIGLLKSKREAQSSSFSPHIEAIEQIARHLDASVDSLVWQLRPPVLDEFGLIDALVSYIEQWKRFNEIAVQMDFSGLLDYRPSRETEVVIYRIVQEALSNIAKHANTHRANIVLMRRAADLAIIVEDNGRGFDAKSSPRGLGLIVMQERAALVGGSIDIESAPGAGTTIRVRIPVNAE